MDVFSTPGCSNVGESWKITRLGDLNITGVSLMQVSADSSHPWFLLP